MYFYHYSYFVQFNSMKSIYHGFYNVTMLHNSYAELTFARAGKNFLFQVIVCPQPGHLSKIGGQSQDEKRKLVLRVIVDKYILINQHYSTVSNLPVLHKCEPRATEANNQN